MLDVSSKSTTLREAHARARLTLNPGTAQMIRNSKVPKGDPLTVARVAAIQAAKHTSQIIPYCHPLPVDFAGVEFEVEDSSVTIDVRIKAIHRTGVEMEALTAASVAALTLYDMLKMVDDSMTIQNIELIGKTGGKSSFREEFPRPLRAAVLVLSDSAAAGQRVDESGRVVCQRLTEEGLEVADYSIINDDTDGIITAITRLIDKEELDLVMTTGGTGLGPRDNAPEALSQVIEREVPGIAEAARAYGRQRTPLAMLSRGLSGVRGSTLIVALPGSVKGATEALDGLFPGLLHAFKMIQGLGHDPVDHGTTD